MKRHSCFAQIAQKGFSDPYKTRLSTQLLVSWAPWPGDWWAVWVSGLFGYILFGPGQCYRNFLPLGNADNKMSYIQLLFDRQSMVCCHSFRMSWFGRDLNNHLLPTPCRTQMLDKQSKVLFAIELLLPSESHSRLCSSLSFKKQGDEFCLSY